MKILKFFITVFLIIVTSGIFLSAALIFFAKFQNKSFVGGEIKSFIIRFPQLVTFFNLDEPGDGRFIYLKKKEYFNVVIYSAVGIDPDKNAPLWIKEMIIKTTGVKIVNVDFKKDIQPMETYSDEEMKNLRMEKKKNSTKRYDLAIFYLTTRKEVPSNAGLTLNRDAIYIFKKAINLLSEDKRVVERVERSTLMHEWGHLLGLSHSVSSDCVMSEKVEVIDNSFLKGADIPIEYCEETLQELERIRK